MLVRLLGFRNFTCSTFLAVALISGTGCMPVEAVQSVSSGSSTSTEPRTLAFLDSPSVFLGTVSANSTTLVRLSVTSTGTGVATIDSSSNSDTNFTFNGGTFPGTGGTCTQPIQGNCSIAVLFTAPASYGSYTNTVTLNYTTADVPHSITVTLYANVSAGATLTINGGVAYGYGSKTIGTSTDQTLTVANTGGITASGITASGLSSPLNFKGGTYPGTGGTCGTSLASSATCTIVTTFAPIASTTTSSTLTLSYNNGGTAVTSTLGFSGTGVTLASLTITTPIGDPYDFGTVVIGATAGSVTLTLSNTGEQSATSLTSGSITDPFTFKDGTYPGTGGNCGTTLTAGATCTLVVNFLPTITGLVTTTLVTTYNDGSTTQTLNRGLQGTGANPASLALSDATTYDYGQKVTGSSTDHSFTVTNSGGVSATAMSGVALSAPYSFKGGTYPGTGGNCGTTLVAAGTCTVVVTFAPVSAATFNSTVSVTHHNGIGVVLASRAVTGIGGTAAVLTVNGGIAFNYGSKNVGTSTDQSLTVANSGALSATAISPSGLSAPLNFKGGTYPGTGGTCGATLAGGASCTLITTFAPVTPGVTSHTLSLSYYNASATVSATLGLSGTALGLASLSVTLPVTDPYDFGTLTVGAAAVDVTFTLSNTGGQSATSLTSGGLAAPIAFKGGTYPGTAGTCGATLAASATCTLVMSFLPSSPGLFTDTLVTTYNDGTGSTQTLNHGIQGTGANPAALSISDAATYDYGSRTIGTTTDHSFTITNSGGSTATAMSANALAAPYSYKGGIYPGTGGNCGTTLGSSATCTIIATFSPVASGAFPDTLDVTYHDGLTTTNTTRPITGTGGSVANLSISDGATYDYGSAVLSYSSDKTFTVTNVGAAAASAMNVTGLAAPFDFKGGTYPGTGGTCSTTLGAAGACTIVVTFSPTSSGAASATMTLNYNDSVTPTSSARPLAGVGATILKIVGGGSHTCAMYDTGVIKCWGSDFNGQLGDGGANANQTSAVQVAGITTATDLAAGSDHTCAVLANGRAMCWGADANGQLGNDAALADQGSATLVATYTDFTKISAGGSLTCGLRATGGIVCWGADAEGGVGNDAAFLDMGTPQVVSGLTSNMTDISVGRQHACARRSTSSFRCWGSDSFGQLGNGGGNTNSGIPVTPTPGTANSSAAGGDVSCSILSDGSVKCWGADDNGQLGDSVSLTSQTSPTTVAGLADVTSIALGANHGCAKTATNTMQCWGDDFYGQLGDDLSTTDQPTPVTVTGIANVSIIGVGEYHSCTVLTSGAAYCFGANGSGQLGNISPLIQQATPVLVQGL